MSHIAVMSIPLHGHVHPLLGLAAELAGRGHEVSFATGDELATTVAATGARPVTYTSVLRSGRTGHGRWMPADDDGRTAVDLFAAERDAALEPLVAAYGAAPPGLVVYDVVTAVAPRLAAAWDVPAVPFHPTHVPLQGQPTHGGALPGDGDGPALVGLPRSLQFRADDVAPHHHFVGPLDWQRDPTPVPPPAGRRALVSLGTTFNDDIEVLRLAAAAIADLGPDWEVQVALGRPVTSSSEGWPSAAVVERWLPQQAVLETADLFVTAGGTGSVLEAVRSRTPMVVLPQAVEQFLNAHQVAHLGLGLALPPDRAGAAALRDVVHRAIDLPGYDAAVGRLNAEIDAAGGAIRAADIVEEHLRRKGDLRAPLTGPHAREES